MPSYEAPSAQTAEDILKILPAEYKVAANDVVREALVSALLALVQRLDGSVDELVADADATRAEGAVQDVLLGERSVPRDAFETDADYRERAWELNEVASFAAIRDAVNEVLADVTDVSCRVVETQLDRWFIASAATRTARASEFGMSSHLDFTPKDPTRLYDVPEGEGVAGNAPVYARVFSGITGRRFMVLVPDLSGLESVGLFADNAANNDSVGIFLDIPGGDPMLVGDGRTVAAIHDAVVRAVTENLGHSIRWFMLTATELDPVIFDLTFDESFA